MLEMLIALLKMEIAQNFGSVVSGRRNWVIYVVDNYTGDNRMVLFAGRFGEADRRGLLVNSLSDIARRHIRIYMFTYKKDYEKALNTMKAFGYDIW